MEDEAEALEAADLSKILRKLHKIYRDKHGKSFNPEDFTMETEDVDLERGYCLPKKPKKRIRKDSSEDEIKLGNKYAPLSDPEDCEDMSSDNDEERAEVSITEPKPQQQKKLTTQKTPTKTATQPTTKTFTQSTATPQKTETKISPIIVRDKTKWTEISRKLTDKNIHYTKAKLIQTGIQIEPTTEDDYRRIYKTLKDYNTQFYTYQLRSEQTLKVVLRGVIQEITEDEIRDDLTLNGFPVTKVTRMNGRRGPAPLVLIEIPREYSSIYQITKVCNLTVTTETLNNRTGIVQCHRCQLFGHVQKHCYSEYRCLKCGDGHSTHECTKPLTLAAKCANCGGEHLSSSLECIRNPNKKRLTTVTQTKSWAQVASPPTIQPEQSPPPTQKSPEFPTLKTPRPTDNTERNLHTTLGEMLANFADTNATTDQYIKFIEQTKRIIQLFKTR